MVHSEVNKLRKLKSTNPIKIIGNQLAKKYKLICFDELEIIDIADAMIMSKLFTTLLNENLSFIITSNFIPEDLYKDGLQRQQFLPFIDLIHKKMNIININNNYDLRMLNAFSNNPYFFFPLDSVSKNHFIKKLNTIKKNKSMRTHKMQSMGRELVFNQTYNDILLIDFNILCSYKFSPNDYIAMSNFFKWFLLA